MTDMTDQELIEAVAIEILGWHLEVTDNGGFAGPDVWTNADGTHGEFVSIWNPLNDANHWMMVVEKLQELGWNITIDIWSDKIRNDAHPDANQSKYNIGVFDDDNKKYYFSDGNQIGHAVCLAAREAMRNKANA